MQRLKAEHYQLTVKSTESEQQLKLEQENSVNYEYLKNILISFFVTNDVSVQANLLRVVFVAMKFTEEEVQRVGDAFNNNNQTLVGRMISNLF
jgi:hypothetical protein